MRYFHKITNIKIDIKQLQHVVNVMFNSDDFPVCLTEDPADPISYTKTRGIFWNKNEEQESIVDQPIDESKYTQLRHFVEHTYLREVYELLSQFYRLGRVRLLQLDPRHCLSWHRDPENRVHIPIFTDPGALMVIEHEVNHLPADGHAWFTETKRYHNSINGGSSPRIHLVGTIL